MRSNPPRLVACAMGSSVALLPPSFADWGLILFPSFAPCVRFRPRFTLSHLALAIARALRRWLRPPSLAAPLPTHKHFFPFRVLRPCVRVHPRLAQVPAMAVTSCGPPYPPNHVFLSVIVLRPCVRFRQRPMRWNAARRGRCLVRATLL